MAEAGPVRLKWLSAGVLLAAKLWITACAGLGD
jgi:hypothetical protein